MNHSWQSSASSRELSMTLLSRTSDASLTTSLSTIRTGQTLLTHSNKAAPKLTTRAHTLKPAGCDYDDIISSPRARTLGQSKPRGGPMRSLPLATVTQTGFPQLEAEALVSHAASMKAENDSLKSRTLALEQALSISNRTLMKTTQELR